MNEIKEEDIKITDGEDDPLFNGIFISTGCECSGYSCDYYDRDGVSDNRKKSKCYIKKNNIKSQILQNQKLRQLVEEQIEFQRQIEPPNYNSTSLLHIFQSLLDEVNKQITLETKGENKMNEDIQIIEAQKDIERSGYQIGQLETLDKDTFPKGLIDNLISFHKIRIKNCQNAINTTVQSRSNKEC